MLRPDTHIYGIGWCFLNMKTRPDFFLDRQRWPAVLVCYFGDFCSCFACFFLSPCVGLLLAFLLLFLSHSALSLPLFQHTKYKATKIQQTCVMVVVFIFEFNLWCNLWICSAWRRCGKTSSLLTVTAKSRHSKGPSLNSTRDMEPFKLSTISLIVNVLAR